MNGTTHEKRRTAAVFCTTYLPYSQTFVWDEVRSHERYTVEVFAWRRRNAGFFPGAVHVARPWFALTARDGGFARRFAAGGIALVHAHFGWAGVYAAGYAQRHGLPLVVSFHGYDVALLGRWGPPAVWPYTWRAEAMLERMTLGLCASAELLELLVTQGVPRERLAEHRLGVDLERFRPGPREPAGFRVAMVGRLVEKKGFADGLRAFATALRGVPAAQLSLAGTGPLEGHLRRLAGELGIEPQVHFLGERSHDEVAGLLTICDVLLAPSAVAPNGDRDSGLMVVKEASASQCVPVATRHGGIPAIIDHGVTGFLAAEHDVQALAEHMGKLRSDPRLRDAMGRAARAKMAREYALRDSVRRLERYYDEAIRRHTASERLPAGIDCSRASSE